MPSILKAHQRICFVACIPVCPRGPRLFMALLQRFHCYGLTVPHRYIFGAFGDHENEGILSQSLTASDAEVKDNFFAAGNYHTPTRVFIALVMVNLSNYTEIPMFCGGLKSVGTEDS